MFHNLFGFGVGTRAHCIVGVLVSVVPVNVMNMFFGSAIRSVFKSKLLVINYVLLLATTLLTFSCCTGPHRGRDVSVGSTFVVNLTRTYTIVPKLSHSKAAVTANLLLKGGGTGLTRFSFLVIVPPVLNRTLLSIVGTMGNRTMTNSVPTLSLIIKFVTTFMSKYVTYG